MNNVSIIALLLLVSFVTYTLAKPDVVWLRKEKGQLNCIGGDAYCGGHEVYGVKCLRNETNWDCFIQQDSSSLYVFELKNITMDCDDPEDPETYILSFTLYYDYNLLVDLIGFMAQCITLMVAGPAIILLSVMYKCYLIYPFITVSITMFIIGFFVKLWLEENSWQCH